MRSATKKRTIRLPFSFYPLIVMQPDSIEQFYIRWKEIRSELLASRGLAAAALSLAFRPKGCLLRIRVLVTDNPGYRGRIQRAKEWALTQNPRRGVPICNNPTWCLSMPFSMPWVGIPRRPSQSDAPIAQHLRNQGDQTPVDLLSSRKQSSSNAANRSHLARAKHRHAAPMYLPTIPCQGVILITSCTFWTWAR